VADPNDEYYILDSRTVVGNCASWWCPDGKGYTCELDKAGLYSRDEAIRKRETDVPVPRALVELFAIRHVRLDWLRDRIDVRGYEKTTSREERASWCAAVLEAAPAPHPPRAPEVADAITALYERNEKVWPKLGRTSYAEGYLDALDVAEQLVRGTLTVEAASHPRQAERASVPSVGVSDAPASAGSGCDCEYGTRGERYRMKSSPCPDRRHR